MQTSVPQQRWGQANEVAKTVVFLTSDDSSNMTGGDIM
ncbi:SDR family oxidoreductase [Mucilaginibacter sp. SP1R1]